MESLDAADRTYAWNWFALHAGQRLQLVNFWLVSVAFLVAAFVQAYLNKHLVIAAGVSTAGIVSSLAFMRLDVRTRQLVHVGEAALRQLELERAGNGRGELIELVERARQSRTSSLHSYRVVIQGLELTVAGLFALATAYCVFSS
jgi:hypothetical protein